MADRVNGPMAAMDSASGVSGPEQASGASSLAYTNTKACPCGRPIHAPEAGTRGRRPRFCSRCREERKALRFIRAAARILERLKDPEWEGSAP
jgi:hypothetical protein